jgi:hypothetical protein
MFLEVTDASYVDAYRIRLSFNNGETKVVDLEHELNGSVYEPLHDINYFKRFQLKFNTIEWPNGADYAPEYLYRLSLACN